MTNQPKRLIELHYEPWVPYAGAIGRYVAQTSDGLIRAVGRTRYYAVKRFLRLAAVLGAPCERSNYTVSKR